MGPVAPASADAWIGWAQELLRTLHQEPRATGILPPEVLDEVASYVDEWAATCRRGADRFHWQVDVRPEQLEYLTNALYNLDTKLADVAGWFPNRTMPAEGRAFHLILVQALLFALAQDSPGRAAFAEQLRESWPVAADA